MTTSDATQADAGERRRRGREVYGEVMTFAPPQDSGPAADSLLELVFAEVWTREGLSRRDRRFVTLACVAEADVEQDLAEHVYAALNSGDLSITEMREAVLHFAVYAGWPKASRFNGVVDRQWERIHHDRGVPVPPPEPLLPLTTASDPESRLVGGEQSFREINCLSFAPDRDNPYQGAGILNFVFGEMWLRPGLGLKERRLITVACVGFQDAPTPIVSHVYAALKSRDVSFTEMDELVGQVAVYCGWPKAAHLSRVVAEVTPRVLAEWQTEDTDTGQEQS